MTWVRWGSWLACLGVALGAFGAHGLREKLSTEAKAVYQTAVLYHLLHAVALLGVGWMALLKPMDSWVRLAGWSFCWGIVVFSGSLYALSLTGVKWLGLLTPFGGLALLLGWVALALAAR